MTNSILPINAASTGTATWHIQVQGLVQGVGFRPFVFALANHWGLQGSVCNQIDGVHVLVSAPPQQAVAFCEAILQQAPPLAQITGHQIQQVATQSFNGFAVVEAQPNANHAPGLWIPPDFALCPECHRQLMDGTDRRYRYPFITCTTCGPRYSILQHLPFDRHHTTMHPFCMCAACRQEYDLPTDSRFYAQTNSCATCGIALTMHNQQGVALHKNDAAINAAVAALKAGQIVAVKGIGGFLLLADAANTHAIRILRQRKHRPTKPLAIMYPSLQALQQVSTLTAAEKYWLQHPAAPIVLLPIVAAMRQQLACEQLAPGLLEMGVMLPYAPLLALLLADMGRPLVATSGNLSGAPVIYQNQKALQWLSAIADLILVHNRDILIPQDDSVLRLVNEQPIWLRRSRGLAPALPWYHPKSGQTVLATGALIKSTFCLAHSGQAYLSQYLGNTDSYDAQLAYRHTLAHLQQLVQAMPQVVLADKHPHYFSHQLAQEIASKHQIPFFTIQHHKAHAAAILAEHHLVDSTEPVLCVVWDGTGLGEDGSSWGGEFFTYHQHQFTRAHHVGYFPYLLPQKMAREPRLSALCMLHHSPLEAAIQHLFTPTEWTLYRQMLQPFSGISTSAVGRLFDAVACLLLDIGHQSFEGEAAMQLEAVATSRCREHGFPTGAAYPVAIQADGSIGLEAWLQTMVEARQRQVPIGEIAAKFHYSLAVLAGQMGKQRAVINWHFPGACFKMRCSSNY